MVSALPIESTTTVLFAEECVTPLSVTATKQHTSTVFFTSKHADLANILNMHRKSKQNGGHTFIDEHMPLKKRLTRKMLKMDSVIEDCTKVL